MFFHDNKFYLWPQEEEFHARVAEIRETRRRQRQAEDEAALKELQKRQKRRR